MTTTGRKDAFTLKDNVNNYNLAGALVFKNYFLLFKINLSGMLSLMNTASFCLTNSVFFIRIFVIHELL